MVGGFLVGFIERMGVREFVLVISEAFYLFRVQDAELGFLFRDFDLIWLFGGEVVAVS